MSTDSEKTSTRSMREELENLDSQISKAKAIKKALEEERKPLYSVYKWESPERAFEPKDKKWYLIVSSISMFIIVLSLLTENYGLVVAIVALIVLLYALNSVPPNKISHEITNKGLSINKVLYTWKNIKKFWINKRGNHYYLNTLVLSKNDEEDQLIVYLGDADVKNIVTLLLQYVDYIADTDINNNFISSKLFGVTQPFTKFID